MYIEKIILKNFRGAADLTVELDRHLNVFYGENGAGKSTVLDAAAIMLSWVIARIRYGSASGESISEEDIKNDSFFSSLTIICKDENINRDSVQWSLTKEKEGFSSYEQSKGRNSSSESSNLKELNGYTRLLREANTRYDGKARLPLLVYYPVNRTVQEGVTKIKGNKYFENLAAYNNALTGKSDFSSFFSWFKEREDLENEQRLENSFQYSDEQLNVVRFAIENFMLDIKNLKVRRKPLRLEVEKKGQKLIVSQLSDGERMMIALVGDLARRLAILNPEHNRPLEGKGIVLIDEVDMHLHPKWQSVVVGKFREIFPNIQFIVSTHSPHVLNHVQPENLFVLEQTLDNIEVSHPHESYGKNADRVLEDLMGLETTRPDEVEKQLNQLFDFIQDNKLAESRKLLGKLRDQIGEDPDLVKADFLIDRMEIIGK